MEIMSSYLSSFAASLPTQKEVQAPLLQLFMKLVGARDLAYFDGFPSVRTFID